jgi:hypothetical protein
MTHVQIGLITDEEIKAIAEHYQKSDDITESVDKQAWAMFVYQTFAYETGRDRRNANLHQVLDVQYITGQPYSTTDEMRADWRKNLLKISTDYNNSPLMPGQVNLWFRAAHDIHHCLTKDCNFNLWGELCAFVKFALHTQNVEYRRILFCEIVAQVCYLRVYGHYAEQKIVDFSSFQPIIDRIIRTYN